MTIYCLSVRVPASQVPNHKIYKELQYNEEVGWLLTRGALNWTIMHSIACIFYGLALEMQAPLTDKQYIVIIVSVFCIMIVVNVCF